MEQGAETINVIKGLGWVKIIAQLQKQTLLQLQKNILLPNYKQYASTGYYYGPVFMPKQGKKKYQSNQHKNLWKLFVILAETNMTIANIGKASVVKLLIIDWNKNLVDFEWDLYINDQSCTLLWVRTSSKEMTALRNHIWKSWGDEAERSNFYPAS